MSGVIKTIRLFLEPLKESHAPKMFAGLRDERAYRFLSEEPPETLQTLSARYALLAGGISPNGKEVWLNWALKRRGQEFYVGYVQATILRTERAATIAFHLFPDHWGHGYAREAVKAMLAAIGPQYQLREVRAEIDHRNARSINTIEALGFQGFGPNALRGGLAPDAPADILYILKLET